MLMPMEPATDMPMPTPNPHAGRSLHVEALLLLLVVDCAAADARTDVSTRRRCVVHCAIQTSVLPRVAPQRKLATFALSELPFLMTCHVALQSERRCASCADVAGRGGAAEPRDSKSKGEKICAHTRSRGQRGCFSSSASRCWDSARCSFCQFHFGLTDCPRFVRFWQFVLVSLESSVCHSLGTAH